MMTDRTLSTASILQAFDAFLISIYSVTGTFNVERRGIEGPGSCCILVMASGDSVS